MRTQVGIIGSGPAGLLLSQLLARAGIDSIILERRSRTHVEGRIRAGVLEWNSVETLRRAGIGDRMDREGLVHDGFTLAFSGDQHRIDLKGLTGKSVMVYGQTEVTKDLIDARLAEGGTIVFEAEDVTPHGLEGDAPVLTYRTDAGDHTLHCDVVAACDGFHGIGRRAMPSDVLKTYERVYPFGWLGLLAEVPPVAEELIYANHARGFALCSMRTKTRSRYYLQCPADTDPADWPDERFFEELALRIGSEAASALTPGPSIEKSIAPLRSFVAEPMRHGRLFLAGDAAHIVPPTGAKGLNLAIADVALLADALVPFLKSGETAGIDGYSARALARIWKVERFSWWMSSFLHQYPEHSPFEKRMQRAEFDYIASSEAAARTVAENYVGLGIA